jgi:hypothetical protein
MQKNNSIKVIIDTLGYTIYYGMEGQIERDLQRAFYSYVNHTGDFNSELVMLKEEGPCFGYFASNEENLKLWFKNKNLSKVLGDSDKIGKRKLGDTEERPYHAVLADQMAQEEWDTLFTHREPFVQNLKSINYSLYNYSTQDL